MSHIREGIEAGVIVAWVTSKPGAVRTHWRMTPESVEAYRALLSGASA